MAVASYRDTHGHYPPAFIAGPDGKPMHSWRVLILPFLEHHALFEKYDFSQPWNSEDNLQLAEQMPHIYAFSGEYRPGVVTTNYLAVVGNRTFWPGSTERTTEDIADGAATTILLVENSGANVHWMEPRDLEYETMSFQVNSPAGISSKYLAPAVVLVDGSLRRLEDDLSESVLRALMTVGGGEQLEEEGETWRLLHDGRLREVRAAR